MVCRMPSQAARFAKRHTLMPKEAAAAVQRVPMKRATRRLLLLLQNASVWALPLPMTTEAVTRQGQGQPVIEEAMARAFWRLPPCWVAPPQPWLFVLP